MILLIFMYSSRVLVELYKNLIIIIIISLLLMNLKDSNEVQVQKIIEKLFIYADNKDLNINRIRNLIVNPQIIRVLIHQLASMTNEQKINILAKLAAIFKRNSLNIFIMFKRDREILEFNHSIFDQIVTFIFQIKLEFKQNIDFFQSVKPMIVGYPISSRNIKNIISKISKNFHLQNFNVQKLQLCLLMLQELYKSQAINTAEPKCFFYMYGPNSGVRLINQQLKWTLAKGMYLYLSFCMESYQHEEMNLLHINVNNDSFQICINQENYLTVKVFQGNKVNRLRKIEDKKWYFLKLAYCLKTGIIRNTYQLVVHIQNQPYQLRDLPLPNTNIQNNIDELIIGNQFYGKINIAAISRKQIKYWPKNGVNNWSQIQGLLAANKENVKQIFLLYSPLITTKASQTEIIFQISSKNHGQLLQNTALHNNPLDEVDINYYGGLYTLMPFFYILKFYKHGVYESALQDMLKLVLTVFESNFPRVEEEAVNCQLFGTIGLFINQIDERYITVNAINYISSIKDHIQSKILKKQFLQNFLLKIRIDRIQNLKVIQSIHKLIASFYYKDFAWALEAASLYQIIWYVIDNFQPQNKEDCCLLHCWQQSEQGLDDEKIHSIEEHYKIKCEYMKQLIRFIIKSLCNTRRYDLLLQKTQEAEQAIVLNLRKKKDKFSIFEYLKFQNYSICLKKMLLQCIQVGVQEDPHTLIKQTQLLSCLFGLLSIAELRDQFVPVVKILNQCSKTLSRIKDERNLQIIKQIGNQLDKIYMKKYAAIRLRSKSEGIPIQKKFSQRKISNQMQDNLSSHSEAKDEAKQRQRDIKNKILKLKKQKNSKIVNDKQLYDILMSLCCGKQPQSGDVTLVDDDCTKIINPYFKICSPKFRVKLIQMIRTTMLVKFRQQNMPAKMESLSQLDQTYRFILSQFILKQLDPDDPEYKPSQQSNYIIKNFFFIIDHMVISMKNDWDSLYLLVLRLIGVLTEAKKDIHIKTSRSKQQILIASKVCVRKFLLRVLKYAEKSIENMSNMVFLVYLVVFNNPEPDQKYSQPLFQYFQSLEQNFFIGRIKIKNQDDHQIIQKYIFVDDKIILTYLDGFKMDQVFNKDNVQPSKKRRYIINLMHLYFEKDESNQLQDYLFKLRKVFLSKSHFKDLNSEDNKGIRKMISKFMINSQQTKQKEAAYHLHVGQIIGLLLCITIQAAINTDRMQILKQSLNKYALFIKAFALSCSRDNLTKKQHPYRDQNLPRKIIYHLIHFIYSMLQQLNQKKSAYRQLMEETLYDIISYLTIMMTILSEKVGNPTLLNDLKMLSSVMVDVQQFNFYSLQVFSDVLTLDEIKMFSTIPKSKAMDVINHRKMKQHFKLSPQVFLQKHIKQAVEVHKHNIEKIQSQLEQKFKKRKSSQMQTIINQPNQFEEYRLDHARKIDFQYRHTIKIWRKIWKRLRLYHYFWSVSMDQREEIKCEWEKSKYIPYKHKFGKYSDLQGLRPILQVQPTQPWHVRKSQLEQQVKYRNKNYMVNLYKLTSQKNIKTKTFMDFILRKSVGQTDYFQVLWIKHNSKRKGRLTLTKQKMIFQYESTFQKDSHVDFTSFTLAEHRTIEKTWNLVTIVNIIRRRYLMREQSVLIQFEDSSYLVLDFINDNVDAFMAKIQQIQAEKSQMINFIKANKITFYLKRFRKVTYQQQIEQATHMWCEGKITNLHYLMALNKYSGRSYLDPVNYPVMPWVVSNYDFKQFVYRDLSKTLGALGDPKRKHFYQTKVESIDPFNNVPPYQYGTHYSSPGVVFNFLIRISPYTQAAKTLQGGKFDLSDRLFSSIKVCWNSVKNQVSDVRELNPQFYYLPQFLINIQNHDFGMTQLKQRVDNVKLPMWASNAYQFIYMHRRALQNDQVSTNLQNWIDLIFGYKQKGKIARQNLNLYYYLTYENSIDLKNIEDSVQRTSIQAQIIHFGQTPSQIFFKPHPNKNFLKSSKPFSEAQKIKFLGFVESRLPILLIGETQQNNFLIFNDSSLLTVQMHSKFQILSQVSLLRSTSKEGMYFVEDLSAMDKIVLFGNNKFIAVSSYVNGDLVIYNTSGKKINQKKGTPKSIIYVDKKQNLLLCGCKNGLLQVYQIVYAQKESVNLIKIISEYFMFPIEHISEGGGFFSISSGNLVVINKITRGLNYIYDKVKMQGSKMIRSFESKRKVHGSFICTNPLYCLVMFNSLQIYIYSINGQFLKLKQIQNIVNPVIMVDCMNRQNVLALQPTGLLVLKLPELQTVCSIPIPSKQYTDMKIIKDRLYLVTNNGEILYLFNQKQVMFY